MKRPLNYKFLFLGTVILLGVFLCLFSWIFYKEFGTEQARLVRTLEYESASVCSKSEQLLKEFNKKHPEKLEAHMGAQQKAWDEAMSHSQACDESRVELVYALMIKYGFEKLETPSP